MPIINALGQTKFGVRSGVLVPTITPLLDSYSNSTAAYSLRKLKSSYTGSAIRVRRSSDNAEQNIGFDSNGDLNTTALLSFVGSGNGFVTIWYDQSGNGFNMTQTTPANQPQIVSSGSVILQGSKPSMQWDGINDNLSCTLTGKSVSGQNMALITVSAPARSFVVEYGKYANVLFPESGGWGQVYQTISSDGRVSYRFGTALSGNTPTVESLQFTNVVVGTYKRGSVEVARINGFDRLSFTDKGSSVVNTQNVINAGLGEFTTYYYGKQCEIIFYLSDVIDNRFAIERNINSYYSITSFATVTDTDAQSFLNATGIITTTEANAINTLVTSLKSYGLWTKMRAIYPFVGGTSTTHKFNLKDPRDLDVAYRLTFVNTWTHTSTGAKPNGSNAYARTFLVPSTVFGLTNSNIHMSKYQRENLTIGSTLWLEGVFSGSSPNEKFLSYGFSTQLTGSSYVLIGNKTSTDVQGVNGYTTNTQGYFVFSRTSNTSIKAFRNNGLAGSLTYDITSLAEVPKNEFLYGARNDAYDFQLRPNGYNSLENSFSTIGDGLTDTEAANLYTIVQTYQTSLGRQVYDSDAQAFLTATGITNSTQINAIVTLVASLKSNGLWTKMKAIYPFVGGTATTHKFNLKDPRDLNGAYRLTFSGGGSHTSNGYAGNANNAWADTNLNAQSVLNNTNLHISFYSRNAQTAMEYSNEILVNGTYNSSNFIALRTNNKVGGYNAYFTAGSDVIGGAIVSNTLPGFFIGSKTSTSLRKFYRNGNVIATSTTNDTNSLPSLNISLLGTGINLLNYSGNEAAFVTIGDGLTDSEASTLYTIVQAYQTTLGRQV